MAEQTGITVKKSEDFSEWYTQIIQKAELADYTEVSGCMVLRPRSYEIWEKIRDYFDEKIKKDGVKNAYFPLLIPEKLLQKEADHVEGFSPEVAWVTHSGSSKLNERLAVRPTSETIMYNSYKDWIESHRDLPLRINQWNNVVRWEFKHPTPFIRTREFLWQEGHTVFATSEEAQEEVWKILDFYQEVYEGLLAVPMLKGKKSEKEKFAGAVYTTSVEAFLPNGRAAQGATSHFLGQNFAKAFGISFTDEDEKEKFGWQNSWGLSTRAIGIMIMTHGDDKGLVIPPRAATEKVVIVPILFKDSKEKVLMSANKLKENLSEFNPIIDDREEYTPGWKFNNWELKGIPLRVEVGPRDIEKGGAMLVRRDTGEKEFAKNEEICEKVGQTLEKMQKELFEKAKQRMEQATVRAQNMEELKKAIEQDKLVLANWCESTKCEETIKFETGGAKTLNSVDKKEKGKCVYCNKSTDNLMYFAKSY